MEMRTCNEEVCGGNQYKVSSEFKLLERQFTAYYVLENANCTRKVVLDYNTRKQKGN